MKSLAHWAIHQQQKIRIGSRADGVIRGQLVGPGGEVRPFVYNGEARRLTIGEGEQAIVLTLDEYGFETAESTGGDD